MSNQDVWEKSGLCGTSFDIFNGVYCSCYTVYQYKWFWSYIAPDVFVCFSTFPVFILLCSSSLSALTLFPSSMYSQADKTLPPMDAEIRARDYHRLNSWCALLSGHDTHVVCSYQLSQGLRVFPDWICWNCLCLWQPHCDTQSKISWSAGLCMTQLLNSPEARLHWVTTILN